MASLAYGRAIQMVHHGNHGGAFKLQWSLSCAAKGRREGLTVARANLGGPRIRGVLYPASHSAQVAHVHLGPISLIPPKTPFSHPPDQIKKSLPRTPAAAANLSLNPVLGNECSAEGGGEDAHLRLYHPWPLLEVFRGPLQRLHLRPQLCRPHFGLLPLFHWFPKLISQSLHVHLALLDHVDGQTRARCVFSCCFSTLASADLLSACLSIINATSTPVTAGSPAPTHHGRLRLRRLGSPAGKPQRQERRLHVCLPSSTHFCVLSSFTYPSSTYSVDFCIC